MNHQNTSSDYVNIRKFSWGQTEPENLDLNPKDGTSIFSGYLVCFRQLKVIYFIIHGFFLFWAMMWRNQIPAVWTCPPDMYFVLCPVSYCYPKCHVDLYLLTLIHNKKLEPVKSYLEAFHVFNFSEFTMWILTILFHLFFQITNWRKRSATLCINTNSFDIFNIILAQVHLVST